MLKRLSSSSIDIKLEKYKSLSEHNGDHGNHYEVEEKPTMANGHTPVAPPQSNGTTPSQPQNHTPSPQRCPSLSPQPSVVRLEEVKVVHPGEEGEENHIDGTGRQKSSEELRRESYFEVHITSS